MQDVIIIGAGAAGLMAANEISKKGKSVMILEGRNRIGGRMHTINNTSFSFRVEAGAEFVHGELTNTIKILKEANINHEIVSGESWQLHEGKIKRSEQFEYWDELLKKLKNLEQDEPIAQFLDKNFNDKKYSVLKKTVIQFVEGYDAADTTKASSKVLYKEWNNEDDEHQYRIKDGYIKLAEHLSDQCKKNGVEIELNAIVKEIHWKENECKIITSNGKKYKSSKVICTVPISILQRNEDDKAYIKFIPSIDEKINSAKQIGFGGVIKIVLEFKNAFWEDMLTSNQMKNVGFIFSEAFVPTWWSQLPYNKKMLTGWIAGPKALSLKEANDDEILDHAINSLQEIFNCPIDLIKKNIKASLITNWHKDPFSLGAYSYATLETAQARKILKNPVNNTIFFGGEALFEGPQSATVEGALQNGKDTAQALLTSFTM